MDPRQQRKKEGFMEQAMILQAYAADVEPNRCTPRAIDLKQKALENLRDKFLKVHEDLYDSCPAGELQVLNDSLKAFETIVAKADNDLEMIRQGLPVRPGPGDPPPVIARTVALPKTKLKSFSGNVSDWSEFYDLFSVEIGNRLDLQDVQKFTYLKNCLEGEPAGLVKGLTITSENYQIGLKILKERYDDRVAIRDSFFRKFFGLTKLPEQTSVGLRKLVSVLTECLQGLRNLGEPVQHWDSWVVFVIRNKMDSRTAKAWQEKLSNDDNKSPTISDLTKFLSNLARNLEILLQKSSGQRKEEVRSHAIGNMSCFECGKDGHLLSGCPTFLNLSVVARKEKVSKLGLCFNCFAKSHVSSSCTRNAQCRLCGGKHHSLIHQADVGSHACTGEDSDQDSSTPLGPPAQGEESPESSTSLMDDDTEAGIASDLTALSSSSVSSKGNILLATAMVNVCTVDGPRPLRALMDPGSQASFLTSESVQRLGLKSRKISQGLSVTGVGGSGLQIQYSVDLQLSPVNITGHSNPSLSLTAGVMKHITAQTPRRDLSVDQYKDQLQNFVLADKNFAKPGRIDILLGADVYSQILVEQAPVKLDSGLLLQNTMFGWIITGKLMQPSHTPELNDNMISTNLVLVPDLDVTLKRFWELEGVSPGVKNWTLEEKNCEQHFVDTHRRLDDGRYEVCLPWRPNKPELGNSRNRARIFYEKLERRWQRFPDRASQQRSGMDEYLSLGHAEPVSTTEPKLDSDAYYLPYHVVEKPSSTTTKYRNVFNASAVSTSGKSLNDQIMVGPVIQSPLFDILLRFKYHRVVLSADIQMMYRMISLSESDRDYHRFFYKPDDSETVNEYRMTTVTFGVASSAHHAQRCLQQLAVDEGHNYPKAAPILIHDFYMDDLLSGTDSVSEALETQKQLINCTESAGFHLRKWISNCPQILAAVPAEDREKLSTFELDYESEPSSAKTLGLYWNPSTDHLRFRVHDISEDIVWTKRLIVSETARVFDPLGVLAPTVLVAKLAFKETCQLGLDWDEVSDDHAVFQKYSRWRKELSVLNDLELCRCALPDVSVVELQLHGFSDASEVGYSAVVYLRSIGVDKSVSVRLLAAKTRVAPDKRVTLPRLELCGAYLLSKLLKSVKDALRLPYLKVFAWSDSMIALDWIHGDPNRWKTFVGNRVSEIQDSIPVDAWRHCSSENNPADCASRGIFPTDLLSHELWWNGPTFLMEGKDWPEHRHESKSVSTSSDVLVEAKMDSNVTSLLVQQENSTLNYFDSWTRLVRFTAWCGRWLAKVLEKAQGKVGSLTVEELRNAEIRWIKIAQSEKFASELKVLKSGTELDKRNALLPLSPFIDKDLLRVGGRLANSALPRDAKFQLLLPNGHRVTMLILRGIHVNNLHAPPRLTLAILRQRYWLVSAYDRIRSMIHSCVKCRRLKAETLGQIMGQLPAARVTPTTRAFVHTGVDYGGPFVLKTCVGRKRQTFKVWVAYFVCFVTKACHIEVVTSLTDDCFLAAFRRMIARRGIVSHMYSDNAGTFHGADRELKEYLQNVKTNEKFAKELGITGVQWHFAPPKASHFGGLYEAGIKSMKTLLYRGVNGTSLTFEEFYTLLCQIEALLNSRPITPLSTDPNDLDYLTPGHFLIGGPLTAIPEPDLTDVKLNRLDRWQLVQNMFQNIWKRYSVEYLHNLQQKTKWSRTSRSVELNDVVLLVDENAAPLNWRMGRVVELFPGKDGHVRTVEVQTAYGRFRRPIAKLTLLLHDKTND